MCLKTRLRSWQYSRVPLNRLLHFGVKAIWRSWQFLTISELRWRWITDWRFQAQYWQRSTYTALDRYPDLFAACRDHLEHITSPKILSYGCSTGDEPLSLSECMPQARIIAVDINRWCLREARRKCKGNRFDFCLRTESKFDRIHDCDAIFCLAVFQRSENRNLKEITESTGIRFEQFEHEIEVLDSKLKPGGLFIIDQSDFSFADTRCSQRYAPVDFEGNRVRRARPLFDRQNRKISEEQQVSRVFLKCVATGS